MPPTTENTPIIKPVTLKFMAAKLKMSISTVSKALHNYPTINEYTRKRVQEMAMELQYVPTNQPFPCRAENPGLLASSSPIWVTIFLRAAFMASNKWQGNKVTM